MNRSNSVLDPNIPRRALSNQEKSRFCTNFVALITHPITTFAGEMRTFLQPEFPDDDSITEDLWRKFHNLRLQQFMAMSIFLIPLSDVHEIVERDFPALAELVRKRAMRLNTSDLNGGDENIVNSDLEADRYVDYWRRVAGKYASCSQ